MLTVTPRATDVIRSMLSDRPHGGLRLAPCRPVGADSAMEIGVGLAPEPAPSDRVIPLAGARVFIDEDIVAVLSDRTLDVRPSDQSGRPVFRLVRTRGRTS